MPIRFRCAYCNQLMGISRRKAGTIVRCPTCAGQLVVPNSGGEEADEAQNGGGALVFERGDFDDLLGAAARSASAAAASAPAPAPPLVDPPPAVGGASSVLTRRIDPPLQAELVTALPAVQTRPGLMVSPMLA